MRSVLGPVSHAMLARTGAGGEMAWAGKWERVAPGTFEHQDVIRRAIDEGRDPGETSEAA